MRRCWPDAAISALVLAAWMAPTALACAPEGGAWPLSPIVARASLAVEGTVVAATAGEYPAVVEISVERVLKGSSDATAIIHDDGACPFQPSAGDRVVVAANGDGGLMLAWLLDGPAAQEWIPTDPQLATAAAIHGAFVLPDTAAMRVPPSRDSGVNAPLLVAVWALSALGLVALISRRRQRGERARAGLSDVRAGFPGGALPGGMVATGEEVTHGPLRSAPARIAGMLLAVAAAAIATGGPPAARAEGPAITAGDEAAAAGAAWTGRCSLGDCGTAALDPSRAPVGARVTVTVDHGYFALFDPDWYVGMSVLLTEVGGYDVPGAGALAPLTLVDDRRATFLVPYLPPTAYEVRFSFSGDEAFGQPVVREAFVVTDSSPPATDAAPRSGGGRSHSGLLALAAGTTALALALALRPRRPAHPRVDRGE